MRSEGSATSEMMMMSQRWIWAHWTKLTQCCFVSWFVWQQSYDRKQNKCVCFNGEPAGLNCDIRSHERRSFSSELTHFISRNVLMTVSWYQSLTVKMSKCQQKFKLWQILLRFLEFVWMIANDHFLEEVINNIMCVIRSIVINSVFVAAGGASQWYHINTSWKYHTAFSLCAEKSWKKDKMHLFLLVWGLTAAQMETDWVKEPWRHQSCDLNATEELKTSDLCGAMMMMMMMRRL